MVRLHSGKRKKTAESPRRRLRPKKVTIAEGKSRFEKERGVRTEAAEILYAAKKENSRCEGHAGKKEERSPILRPLARTRKI